MTGSDVEYDDSGKVRFHDSCVTDAISLPFKRTGNGARSGWPSRCLSSTTTAGTTSEAN
ncbi:MAG: hypothetical protein JWQ86_5049 [Mycobacterium sp.]|jgi:hypothetical protein|nr:hypothetical protein [Mycobacterium sp.]MDT5216908.1 hypothetical protein [Mycobacterium sp.]